MKKPEEQKPEESLKIKPLEIYWMDTTMRNYLSDDRELTLTPANLSKIYNKQCEIIEVVNKILDAKVLIK